MTVITPPISVGDARKNDKSQTPITTLRHFFTAKAIFFRNNAFREINIILPTLFTASKKKYGRRLKPIRPRGVLFAQFGWEFQFQYLIGFQVESIIIVYLG